MQTIGERLEETRKKRAVSLQDAANETKIRVEYITHLEKNDGREIPLPRIYIRGFIRNYAKFLRMDASRLLTDYDANVLADKNTEDAQRAQKELIGRLELGTEPLKPTTLPNEDTPQSDSSSALVGEGTKIFTKSSKIPAWIWPVAAGFIAVLLLSGLIVGISSCAKANQDNLTSKAPSQIKITALGEVTVIVKQTSDKSTLFSGTLKKGEEKNLTATGSVNIRYSDGTQLEIEKEGKRYKMGSSGFGVRIIE